MESEVQRFARLEANAVRNAAARSVESAQQTVNRRAQDALRHESTREVEAEIQTNARRAVDATRHASVREAESELQASARRAVDSSRHASAREAESELQASARRAADATSHTFAREAESEIEASARRAADATRHTFAREAECPQQTAARLAACAARFSATISNETQDEATDRRQSNASIQRLSRDTRQTSKAEYLDVFDASVNGPLHKQPFVDKHMKTFHSELHQLIQQYCLHCRELWPTRDAIVDPYICCRCKKLTEFNPFGIQNDMVRDFSSIPLAIQKHIRELTPLEEMLLSPVISIMCLPATLWWTCFSWLRGKFQTRRSRIDQRDSSHSRATSVPRHKKKRCGQHLCRIQSLL